MKKVVLIAGTINHHPDTEEERFVHLDGNPRPIYDAELDMMFAPDVVARLQDNLPMFADGVFDRVVLSHVLEHMTVGDAQTALLSINRIMKKRGLLEVECPNMTAIAGAWLDGRETHETLQQWIHGEDLAGPLDGHVHSYSPEDLRSLISQSGFKVIREEGRGLAWWIEAMR